VGMVWKGHLNPNLNRIGMANVKRQGISFAHQGLLSQRRKWWVMYIDKCKCGYNNRRSKWASSIPSSRTIPFKYSNIWAGTSTAKWSQSHNNNS
jgi:hypothetical protein